MIHNHSANLDLFYKNTLSYVSSEFTKAFRNLSKHVVGPTSSARYFQDRRNTKVSSVADRVIGIVAEQLGVDKEKVAPETSFVNDLGADSLDTVELVMELEEEFEVDIPDDAAEKIQTVGQAIEFIEQTQTSSSSS
jgi:acyl carrier protein